MRAVLMSLLSLTLILGTAGCTKKKKADYDLDIATTLRINISTEPPSLDWHKSTDTTSALIQDNMMEGLVEYNLTDKELGLKPALATEWRAENNNQTWFFTIRKGVKWTDGQELTAQQFIDGWQRLLTPATAAEYAYFLYGIKNARPFNEGKLTDFSQVGVSVTDKGELKVELTSPTAYFPYLLTHHSTFPVRLDVIAKHGDQWIEPGKIVTLGAYTLKVWDHDKAIVLERNEGYYGEKAKTKHILAYMINELSTALNLFNAGKIDAQTQLPSTELRELRKRAEYRETGILSIYYYGFNVKKPPLDNPIVRKAISHAIDRKEVTQMLDGGQIPLTSWVPPGMFGYEPNMGTEFSPDKAKQLLEQAGYKDRSKFPKIEIGFNTNDDHKRVAENIQAQLKRNLGIDVELKNEEWKVYLKSLKTDPPHIFRLGWLADYPDPDNFLNLMTSYSENNHTRWGSKEFDDLIAKAVGLATQEMRAQVYTEAQKILTEKDVPVAPIYASVAHSLVAPRVVDFPFNSMQRFVFKGVSLK
ncbi:MAG: peptide ABC transporter substrate-binding protein [Bdellovibrionales bacterium]|nr:peptide ABC transporter substrate-binding protein [Bdellovibrionales bacterium]